MYFCLGYRSEVKEARIFHFLEFDLLDQYQNTDNRISDPTDLAAKLPSNLIVIMLDMVRKRFSRWYLQRLLSANPKGSHALLIAHPPILLCSFALHVDWFLTLVLTRLSRFACEIGPICVC